MRWSRPVGTAGRCTVLSDFTLHDYQVVARDYLRERKRAALFLDMGLGKTASALSALTPEHLPALVVAPKKVAEEVWDVERDIWRPDLSLSIAMGDPGPRRAALNAGADITVIGRDNLRDVLSGPSPAFRTMIIDELSGYKTRSSVRWKTARKIIAQPELEYVWGLTGTPSPNGYLDLWAQIYLLDGGERLGKTLTGYRNRYFLPGRQLPNGVIIEWIPREETTDAVNELLSDICLAMETDGRVELPPVTYNHVKVDLPPKVKTAYKGLRDELIVDLRDIFGGEIHTADNAAVMTSRLSQMTAGFIYVDEAEMNDYRYTQLHTEKIDALKEIIEFTDSPVLVFYRFQAELAMIRKAIPEARMVGESGIIKEWNAGKVPVMLAHPASAGHGLNLQHGGHTIVWTTLTWSLEEWQQANKRLARQGQKHPVVIHMLMAPGTVDTDIFRSLTEKDLVQRGLLEYLESPV